MKKLKLDLNDLEVQSFETNPQNNNQRGTIQGFDANPESVNVTCQGDTCAGSCSPTCDPTCPNTCPFTCEASCGCPVTGDVKYCGDV